MSVFDGKGDFGSWKKKMKVFLSHHKVVIALEADETKWKADQKAKAAEIKEEAFNLIFLHLADSVIRKVDGMDNPLDLWSKLDSLYSVVSAPNLVFLKGMLFNYKMDSSKSMDENIDEFTKMTLLLKGTDQALGDSSEAMILLNSLPPEYQVVKNALQYTGTVPKLDLIISGIKARELELNANKRNGNSLYVKGKTDRRESFRGNDQSGSKGKKKDKKGKTKPKWKCFHCGKEGHIKKYCYDFLRKQKQGENGSVSVASTSNNACLSEVLTVSNVVVPDEWILDSGCSFHMSPNRSWFINFDEHESDTVYMGNNNTCTVQGIGDIKLKLHDGKIRLLTNVRYVPGLKRNLISLGTLDEIGFLYLAKNGCLHVTKNDCIVLSGIKKNGLYVLEGVYYAADDRTDSALVSDFNMTELWHLRLGRMCQKGIHILK